MRMSLRKTAVFNSSKQFKQTVQQNNANRFKQYERAVMPATAHGTSPSDENKKVHQQKRGKPFFVPTSRPTEATIVTSNSHLKSK
jgi:hypothetical protein